MISSGYTELSMLTALIVTIILVLFVGRYIALQGMVFIRCAWDESMALRINHSLLIGFYLLNIGYAGCMMIDWPIVHTREALFTTISNYCGRIIVAIGLLHYINLIIIQFFIFKKN